MILDIHKHFYIKIDCLTTSKDCVYKLQKIMTSHKE